MSCSISNCTASMSLATFSKIQALTSKGSLVNITCFSSAEWHPIMLQLQETVGSERPGKTVRKEVQKTVIFNLRLFASSNKKTIISVLSLFLYSYCPLSCSINCKIPINSSSTEHPQDFMQTSI